MRRAITLTCLLAGCSGAIAPPPRAARTTAAVGAPGPGPRPPPGPVGASTAPTEPAFMVAHDAARALIADWVQAQRTGDLDAYLAAYAPAFVGVRHRALDQPVEFDLAGWRADARSVFAARTDVDFEVPELSSGGDDTTVIAEVKRRTRRGRYSDHAVLVLIIETANGPARITHEGAQWSRPGWDDAEQEIVDASRMASPITLRMLAGDCAGRRPALLLRDAVGATASIPFATSATAPDASHAVAPVDQAYAWDDACDGLRVQRRVEDGRTGLVLREAWADATAAGVYVHRLAILAPSATVELR